MFLGIMYYIGICRGIILKQPLAVYGAIAVFIVGHGWTNNAMMAYVENNAYDGTGKQ